VRRIKWRWERRRTRNEPTRLIVIGSADRCRARAEWNPSARAPGTCRVRRVTSWSTWKYVRA